MSSREDEAKRALDDIVRDTRAATESPDVDWEKVEAKLFARVAADGVEREKRTRAARPMWIAGGVLAAAAAAALLLGRPQGPVLDAARDTGAQIEPAAGAIVAVEGEVLVDGRTASAGTTIGPRAVVETRDGARALVERGASSKGAIAFWIEPLSRVVVARTQGALVLSLERGAVEAKVAPADSGEPFAVDIGASRVAVHGTLLRVARAGARVVVDVNEGVVAIGTPPRSGETTGSVVAAPAHAEFAADDAAGTMTIDHSPSSVRPSVAFAVPASAVLPTPAVADPPTTPAPASPTVHLPTAPLVASASASASASAAPRPAPSTQPPAVPMPDPNAETTIARAVSACIASRPPAKGVKLTVGTVVALSMNDDGTIARAAFEPPLAPDTQACATAAVYRVRFTRGGAVSIPVDYVFE